MKILYFMFYFKCCNFAFCMTSTHLAKHSADYNDDYNTSDKNLNENTKENIDKKEKG